MTDKKSDSGSEEKGKEEVEKPLQSLKWKWGKKDLRPKYIRRPKRGKH